MGIKYGCRKEGRTAFLHREILEKEVQTLEEKIALAIGEGHSENAIFNALMKVYSGILKGYLKEIKGDISFEERLVFALKTLDGFKASMRDAILETADEKDLKLLGQTLAKC